MLQDTDTTGPGHTGAKVQSWRKANPRDVLKTIMADVGDNRSKALKVFREKVLSEDGEPYLEAIVEYWFTNNYNSLIYETRKPDNAREVETIQRGYKTQLQRHIVKEAQVMLLDLLMPNGKKLADCTGHDCAKLANTIGPWLQAIAAKIKPRDRVGDKLTEADVREFYKGK